MFLFNGNDGGERRLCLACFEQTAAPEELENHRRRQEIIQSGKCQYCGSPAKTGTYWCVSADGVRTKEEAKLECEECGLDLNEFHRRPENALSTGSFKFGGEEARERLLQQHAERKRREEEYIKQKVAERRLGGN
jgi:hypothetical protein